jgi:peptidyl-prolyl cis-trans isomerase C
VRFQSMMTAVSPKNAVAWGRGHPLAPAGRRGRAVGMVLLGLLAIGSGTAVTVDRIQALPAGAVFRVGDTTVTEQQLDDRVKLLRAMYLVRQPTDPAGLDNFRRDSAKAMAVSQVLDDAEKARNIVIADKTANDELTNLLEKQYPRGRDAFMAQMAAVGVPEREIVGEVRRQLANNQLFDQVTKDVPAPTDQDVAQVYQQRHAEMATPEKRHLRNMVFSSEDRAKQARAQLDGGADFATLARQASVDGSTKDSGGDLGTVTRDRLEPAYGAAAFAAAPNALFGPVRTPEGWNVGQVLAVTPAVPLSLDQIKPQLQAWLLRQHKIAEFNRWLGDQVRDAHVRYADAYRPADPLGMD